MLGLIIKKIPKSRYSIQKVSILKYTVAALPRPPVSDRTRGVKEPRSILWGQRSSVRA